MKPLTIDATGTGETIADTIGPFGSAGSQTLSDGSIVKLVSGHLQETLGAKVTSLTDSSGHDDVIYGNSLNNTFNLEGSGAYKIYAGNGYDTFNLDGSGAYTVYGNNSADTVNVNGSGNYTVFGGNGGVGSTGETVTVAAAATGTDVILGNNGKDTLDAHASSNTDTLFGGNGTDAIKAGTGSDLVIGGLGGDVLSAANSTDGSLHHTTFAYFTNTYNPGAMTSGQAADSPYVAGDAGSVPSNQLTWGHSWDVIVNFKGCGEGGSDVIDFANANNQVAGPSVYNDNSTTYNLVDSLTGNGWQGDLVWLGSTGTDADAGTANPAHAHAVWQDAGNNFVYADINGDGKADLKIQVGEKLDACDFNGVTTDTGPTANNDTGTIDEDHVLGVNAPGLLGNDVLANPGATITVTSFDSTSTGGASVMVNPDGSYSYDPTVAYDHLAQGESADDTFHYTITDLYGKTSTATATITVTGVNDAATFGDYSGDSKSVTEDGGNPAVEGTTETSNGSLAFTDPDWHDTHTASVESNDNLGTLTATVTTDTYTSDGTIYTAGDAATGAVALNYSVDDSKMDYLGAGEHITETFTVDLTEHHPSGPDTVDTTTVSYDVYGTIDKPTIDTAPTTITVQEDASTALNIAASDVDDNAHLTYTLSGLPDDCTIIVAGGNTYSGGSDITLTQAEVDAGLTLQAGEDETVPLHLTVTNTEGSATATAEQDITLTIDPKPEPPTLSLDGNDIAVGSTAADHVTIENPGVVNVPSALDIAGADPDGDGTVTFTISGIPDDVTLANSSGTIDHPGGTVTLQQSDLAGLTVTAASAEDITFQIDAHNSEGGDTVGFVHWPTTSSPGPSGISFDLNPAEGNTSVPGSFQVTDYNGGGTLTYSYTFVGDPGTGSGAWVTSDRALHLHQDANGTLTVIATDGTTTYTQAFDLVTGGDSTTDAIDFSLSTGPTIGDGLGKADVLTGSNNVDYLIGGTGGDTLIGNGGADVLFGGAGNDTFQYNAVSDSTPTAFDTILDFTASGGDADQIDFSPIAGITTVGLLNLTSVPTTIDAHAIIAVQPGDGNTYVYANAGGVGETTSTGPDVMEIKLTGLVALNAADFLHAA